MSVATPSTVPITNYGDFWPHYLREHSKPETRALHYIGTLAGTAICFLGLWTGNYRLIPAGVFVGIYSQTHCAPLGDQSCMRVLRLLSFENRRIFWSLGWALLC